MARLPTVQDMGARPTPRPQRGIATVSTSAVAAPATAMQDLGRTATNIGDQIFDREATAAAKERDAYVSDELRKLLYDPDTGYMNLEGRNAVDARSGVMSKIEALKEKATEGLNATAKRKLEASLTGRVDRALESVDRHVVGARRSWVEGAADARIFGAVQDALINPDETKASLATIDGELRGRAARDGWSVEKYEMERSKAYSALYTTQVERIAAADPVQAMQYLREKQGDMLPTDVAAIEQKLQPVVRQYVGRLRAREDFKNMTPDAVISLQTLEDAVGFPLKINSAYRDPAHNAKVGGASKSQHIHGKAFDIDVRNMSIEQRKKLIVEARKAGFSGIGVYNNSLHFDVGGDRAWGPSYGRESLPEWAAEVVTAPVGDRPSVMERYMQIDDPLEADAFLSESNRLATMNANQITAQRNAASQQAFEIINSGGSIDDISLEQQSQIGMAGMSALRTYEAKLSGGPVDTDPATYVELREMQANDPMAFRDLPLIEYVDRLSASDFKSFVDAQAKPPSDVTGAAASTLMTTAARQLSAAGIDTTPQPGTDAARTVATIQTRLIRWQDAFIESNGRKPTQSEIDNQVGLEVVPIVTGAAYRDEEAEVESVMGALDFNNTTLTKDDDFTDERFVRLVNKGGLKIADQTVTREDADYVASVLQRHTGRTPTLEEVMRGLVEFYR